MRIKILITISCFIIQCYAQQEYQFTMFWNNYSSYNPAYTGLINKHYASVCGRRQWTGFGGEPISATAVYDFKWEKINSGIGMNYYYDQLGASMRNKIKLNYSYQLNLKKERKLSAGISLGILNETIDFSKFKSLNPNDPVIDDKTKLSDNFLDLSLGIAFKSPHLFSGISMTQMLQNKGFKGYSNSISEASPVRHYYIYSFYNFFISKSFDIKPGFLIKSDGSSTQFDLNLLITYKKRYWLGSSYRYEDAVAFMGGVDIKGKYRIGYSYDYTTSEIGKNNYSCGSHEIVLALMLNKK